MSHTTRWLADPSFHGSTANITYPDKYLQMANFALNLVNDDRTANGLGEVTLSPIPSGQQHADSMAYFGYFSHWDTQGYKPYMRYTLLGGYGAIAENAGKTYCTDSPPGSTLLTPADCMITTIENGLAASEWSMMNNDLLCCNNGHRDNILDASHNRVSIGIVYDSSTSTVYFVEDFEDSYVSLVQPILGTGDAVGIVGGLSKSLAVSHLTIYYDTTPQSMTISALDSTFSYGPGSFVGGVFPPCSTSCPYYPGAVSVYASKWQVSSSSISIQFPLADFEKSNGAGIYTIYLQTGASTGTAFLMYSIFVQG